jgi:FkbM family methyltransferase
MQWFVFFRIRLYTKLGRLLSRIGAGIIPGARRLYVRCYDKFVVPKGDVLFNIQGNKMYVSGASVFGAGLVTDGVREQCETELFKKMVRNGMVVVDIGANMGYYTLIAARLVRSSGAVYAFEPEPGSHELLCRNIAVNNFGNIIPVRKAVSNITGKTKFYSDALCPDRSSFAKDNVPSKTKTAGCLEVEAITLDDFFERTVGDDRIDFIKMDVEGAEGLVVDGAERVFQSNSSLRILMEFMPELLRNVGTDPLELLHKLQNYGFQIQLINGQKCTLEPIENAAEFCERAAATRVSSLLLEKKKTV